MVTLKWSQRDEDGEEQETTNVRQPPKQKRLSITIEGPISDRCSEEQIADDVECAITDGYWPFLDATITVSISK